MPSLRQLRGRIRSIQSSKQLMRAMQLVSASKLKRSQTKLQQARAVLAFLDGMLQRVLAAAPKQPDHPLCAKREGPSVLVLFTSDTGLCGSYNTNLIQLAEAHLRRDSAAGTQVVYIGKKGYRYFTKRGFPALEAHIDLAGRPNAAKTEAIGKALMQRFLSGQASSVKLLYSQFKSSTVYRPALVQWLPIELEAAGQAAKPAPTVEYIFEPSPEGVFADLLPRWAMATFQRVLVESFTSEHSARMIAMKNATDNAGELLTELTLQRNKVRQAAITKELSEIVGTAEALQ